MSKPFRILLIEDDAHTIRRIIGQLGQEPAMRLHVIRSAAQVSDWLRRAASYEGAHYPDLIVLNPMLMDGLVLAIRQEDAFCQVPTLVLSDGVPDGVALEQLLDYFEALRLSWVDDALQMIPPHRWAEA